MWIASMETYQEVYIKRCSWWGKSACYSGVIFLFIACFARLGVLFSSNSFQVQFLGVVGGALCLVPIFKPTWLKIVLFCFAFSFPLYGSSPYSSHAFLFEFYLSVLSLVLSVRIFKDRALLRRKTLLQVLLFFYFLLACTSLLLLPVQDIVWKIVLWDWAVFWNAVFFSTPELPLYSVAAVNRLTLFILFVVLLASCRRGRELYHIFFIGLLAGAFWASVAGVFEYYNFFDLAWFREVEGRGARLQSVFANPGWFAEFLSVSIPYILLGFISPKLKVAQKICLFGVLVVCEIAIILTYSRTGWFVYPLVLFVCWFFFYIATQVGSGRFAWKQIGGVFLKVIISVPLTLLLSYVLVFQIFNLMNPAELQEREKFDKRLSQMINPVERKAIWAESLELVKEKPFFGLGYESFKFQNSILKKVKKQWDTPHSFYLQLLVSGGIAGMTLWGVLIFATLYLLVSDLIKNKAYLNIAVILSIVAFHLYGLAQAMQYISLIWFLVFLNIGYAMTIDEKVLPVWVRRNEPVLALVLMLIVFSGIVTYVIDFESKKLATKEKLEIYSLDQEQNNYLGFYSSEQWGEQGVYRWTGSSAIIKLPAAQIFEFTFVCSASDLKRNPLILSVYEGGKQIDEIAFYQQASITKQYIIPGALSTKKELYFSVSRTWNLKKLRVANDSRNLGVAISEPKILEVMPIDGVGFYHWERWQGNPLPDKTDDNFDYRWTGQEAVFNLSQLDEKNVLYFRAGQPGLPKDPLLVQIWQKGQLLKSFQLADTDWHRLGLPFITDVLEPCTIIVTRTWNAKRIGVGEDSRTLGVAVAGFTKPAPVQEK